MANPYRTPAPVAPGRDPRAPLASYEVALAVGLAWALGVMRIVFALQRHEAPSREVDFAWLLVVVAPTLAWKEIASVRGR